MRARQGSALGRLGVSGERSFRRVQGVVPPMERV